MLFSCSYAQDAEINVQPVIQNTVIDSIVITSGRDTIYSTTAPFVNIDSGMYVYGDGIPYGAYVIANTNDSLIRLSATPTATHALDSLNFNYLSTEAYSSGDWLGNPFLIYNSTSNGIVVLMSVAITDSSDQIGNTDVVFFNRFSDSLGLDNKATEVNEIEFNSIIGIVSLTTSTDFGNVRLLTKDAINLALPKGGTLYGRLVARSTPTFTGTRALKLKFRFVQY